MPLFENFGFFVPLIFTLCFSIKLAFWIRLIFKWRFPLSEIPGPGLASWTRFWLVKTIFMGNAAEEFVRVNEEYGPIARIGPNQVIVSDPKTIRKVLAVGSRYTRGPWFDTLRLDPHKTNVISERDPKKHQQMRHVLSAGLNGKDVEGMESICDEHIRDWINMIDRKYVTPRDGKCIPFDFSDSIPFLTLDTISHLCLGESFGCVRQEEDRHGFLSAMRIGMIAQQYTSVILELDRVLQFLGRQSFLRGSIFPSATDSDGVGKMMGIIRKRIKSREAAPVIPNDMLTSFFARGLTKEQAETEIVIVLAGGTDTTSTAAQGIILSILSHPRVYSRLQDEIDYALARGNVEMPIQESLAKQLPYLQACIHEGLRRYPPLFQLRERVVPPEGDILHGYHVPGGTYVGLNGISAQLDDIFGEDPEIFRPERWLIEDEDRLKQMHRTLELAFGYGSSKCLGVNMAYMELDKIIFELFRHFDMSLVNPSQPWKRQSRGIFIQSDFRVRIERRLSLDSLSYPIKGLV